MQTIPVQIWYIILFYIFLFLHQLRFLIESTNPRATIETLYLGEIGLKTWSSYCDSNLGTLEYMTVTLANMPRKTPDWKQQNFKLSYNEIA